MHRQTLLHLCNPLCVEFCVNELLPAAFLLCASWDVITKVEFEFYRRVWYNEIEVNVSLRCWDRRDEIAK